MIGALKNISFRTSFGNGTSAGNASSVASSNPSKAENSSKEKVSDIFFSSVSHGYVNESVKNAIYTSKGREEKNGKYILAQSGALVLGVGMVYGSLLKRMLKSEPPRAAKLFSAFSPANLKKGLGAKLGLVLVLASIGIGFLNKHDAKKTAKERGVSDIKNIVTSKRLEELQEEAKIINAQITEENNRLMTMQYNDNLAVFQKVAAGK